MISSLRWHDYTYFPYERELAKREIATLLSLTPTQYDEQGAELPTQVEPEKTERLVYFSEYISDIRTTRTAQHQLEATTRSGKRQSTRYSVHGLHEYKGKFNPQVAKAILNIFDIRTDDTVLDPFCGSGTTLVECAHLGANGIGFDLNPLAVYITNAKLLALRAPASMLTEAMLALQSTFSSIRKWVSEPPYNERGLYLRDWFDPAVLAEAERLHLEIERTTRELAPFFLCIASDLLRDYSQQDPKDLRIRRRKSALPDTPLHKAFLNRATIQVARTVEAQAVLGLRDTSTWARRGSAEPKSAPFASVQADAAITSPPYAMALPYIDTQRLSLIWLNLIQPSEIASLEGDLTGSRELRRTKGQFFDGMKNNSSSLPDEQHGICLKMEIALGSQDGFRRRVAPTLLYRYFTKMQQSFCGVQAHLEPGAPYALIVGHNHTTLGGIRFDIDTPSHLAAIAKSVGWQVEELIPLQTYHRFGYHMANSVNAETLILLRKP